MGRPADRAESARQAGSASYNRHEAAELSLRDLPSAYSNPDSVDAWRHRRMLDAVAPLVAAYPGASWLTVGDGNFGTDAHHLKMLGAHATASSLTGATLKEAQRRGFIDKFQVQNAEQLTLPDGAVDFVLCKESYHHFPRPAVGFYEMLRVARRGVVLIEPAESTRRPLDFLRALLRALRRTRREYLFEPDGNYVFRLSVRELRKMMLALNHRHVAVRYLNDYYSARAAPRPMRWSSLGAMVTWAAVGLQDLLCRLRLMSPGLVAVVAFKEEPGKDARRALRRAGFRLRSMPPNPYVPPEASPDGHASTGR